MTFQLTETEKRMMALLQPGLPVSRETLKFQTGDGELCSDNNLKVHISRLRQKLVEGKTNLLIFSTYDRQLKSMSYQMVRQINNPYNGRT